MTAASIPLVEPDMRLFRIRLSCRLSLIGKGAAAACPSTALASVGASFPLVPFWNSSDSSIGSSFHLIRQKTSRAVKEGGGHAAIGLLRQKAVQLLHGLIGGNLIV